jgi:hypothetical protein
MAATISAGMGHLWRYWNNMVTVLTILWIAGGTVWAVMSLVGYSTTPYYATEDKKKWAKAVLMTPVWPLFGGYLLALRLRNIWDDSGFGEDFKALQDKLQKENNGKS